MAKVAVEDCRYSVGNRFKLVILASQRAHDLSSGANPAIEREDNKNTVLALREIATNKLSTESLFNLVVQRCRKYIENFINTSEVDVRKQVDFPEESLREDVDVIKDEDLVDDVIDDDELESIKSEEFFDIEDDENISFNDDNIEVDD